MRQFSENEGFATGFKKSQLISNQSADLDNANLNKIRGGELSIKFIYNLFKYNIFFCA
jgi:hypothetical protein